MRYKAQLREVKRGEIQSGEFGPPAPSERVSREAAQRTWRRVAQSQLSDALFQSAAPWLKRSDRSHSHA